MREVLHVLYELSEEARKRPFLETGNMPGKTQSIEFPLSQMTPAQRAILVQHRGLGNSANVYQARYEVTIDELYPHFEVYWDRNFPEQGVHVRVRRESVPLDAEPTLDEVLALLASYAERKAEARAAFQPEVDAATAECEALALQKRQEQEWLAVEKAREAARKAEREAEREAERVAWAQEHGSDHLRRGVAGGYTCTRMYLRERAAQEYPGFVVDLEDMAHWKSRSCPSLAALDMVDAVKAQHGEHIMDAGVVWLTNPACDQRPSSEEDAADTYCEPWKAREAVVVKDRRYYGNWLVREV